MALVKFVKKLLMEISKKMKFDIYNRTTKQTENGVYADNPNMLKQIYAMNDEEIEIIQIYNENPVNNLGLVNNVPPVSIVATEQKPIIDNSTSSFSSVVVPIVDSIQNRNTPVFQEKLFSDNGVDYKINSDGSFKKTWVDADINKFRVVDVETGKEYKLKNKKIQTLDWVKIG